MKIYNVDWAEAARQELAEMGISLPDRDEQFEAWKADAELFIDDCRLAGGPLYDRQREIIRGMIGWEERDGVRRPFIRDSVVMKTRQVGMSWLMMAVELWLILFWGPMRILNAHRRFDEVDDGGSNSSVRSLHGRIREMHASRIPGWLRGRCPLDFKEGMIQNQQGGFIMGAPSSPNVGRGATLDMALLDEFAHSDWSKLVWSSIAQACKRGKVANSTPNGRGNEYYRMVSNYQRRRLERFDFHWSQHPDYSEGAHLVGEDASCPECAAGTHWGPDGTLTSPWYEEQCQILGSEDLIAQELDMSFERSTRARVYPEADRRVHYADLESNHGTRHFVAWDFGYAGATVMICAQLEGTQIQVLAYHENSGQVIDDYIPIVRDWEVLFGPLIHIGDPAGLQRNITSGKGPVHVLADAGIYCDAPDWLHKDATEGIRLTRIALRGGKIGERTVTVRINPLAERLLECLENTHYPLDKEGNRKPGAEMPFDNEYTHGSDAFRYLIHYIGRTMLHQASFSHDDFEFDVILGGVLTREF